MTNQKPQPRVTTVDLDSEEAETCLLEVTEQRQQQRRRSSSDYGSATVAFAALSQQQHQLPLKSSLKQHSRSCSAQHMVSKGNTERVKRAYLVRMAARKAHQLQKGVPAVTYLHDIQHQQQQQQIISPAGSASTEQVAAAAKAANRVIDQAEQDGLMKVIVQPPANKNPYGSNFDHHLLKATESNGYNYYDDDDNDDDKGIDNAQLPMSYDERQRQRLLQLPLHDRKGSEIPTTTTTDYMATHPDGTPSNYTTTTTYTATSTNNVTKKIKRRIVLPRLIREICSMMHPFRLFQNITDIFVRSYFLWLGVPCLLLAIILFYGFHNPTHRILKSGTSYSFWLLFVTRLTVTLGLARLTIYVIVDGFMLGTHLAVKTLGPLVTLAAATGKGWPLMLSTWGLWNLILIHGDTKFQRNWFYWTELELFNLNYEGLLVNSELYTRILFASILCGLLVTAKATVFALKFGRKQFAEYKPRLEPVLSDVVLLSEIGTLAEQAEFINDMSVNDEEKNNETELLNLGWGDPSWEIANMKKKNLNEFLWSPSLDRQASHLSNMTSSSHIGDATTEDDIDVNDTTAYHANRGRGDASGAATTFAEPAPVPQPQLRQLRRSESGRLKIRDLLDTWEVPDEKMDKSAVVTIHDILKFRRALSHLQEQDYLFGDAFGFTNSRDECIASAHSVYYRLLKLAPTLDDDTTSTEEPDVLPFSVLELLCLEDDGVTMNVLKKRKLKKAFTPEAGGGLPLLTFIQAVDTAYKRLVFLRASLENSYLLDGVLERLANGLFYFFLVLFLSSVMDLHPWKLLISFTSILVSVSFALGSSVSRYVEGVLLIAVRRPFDLGDRIFMSDAATINPLPDVTKASWFVEDISLSTTTLRYARTNEVCTVNNWSLASTKIVNLARSPSAKVNFEFKAHISILDEDKLEDFKREMQTFVAGRPNIWSGIAHIRHDMFDIDDERVDITMALRHRNAWQDAGRIKHDRADVFRQLYFIGKKLDIHFEAPAEKRIIYQAGTLKCGGCDDLNGRDILKSSNVL